MRIICCIYANSNILFCKEQLSKENTADRCVIYKTIKSLKDSMMATLHCEVYANVM